MDVAAYWAADDVASTLAVIAGVTGEFVPGDVLVFV